MNMNFKGDARALNIVHFQKGKVFWNQLDEIYHFSWVHKETKKLHFQREPPIDWRIQITCLASYANKKRESQSRDLNMLHIWAWLN